MMYEYLFKIKYSFLILIWKEEICGLIMVNRNRIFELVRSLRVNEIKLGLIRIVLSIWNLVYRYIDYIVLK